MGPTAFHGGIVGGSGYYSHYCLFFRLDGYIFVVRLRAAAKLGTSFYSKLVREVLVICSVRDGSLRVHAKKVSPLGGVRRRRVIALDVED